MTENYSVDLLAVPVRIPNIQYYALIEGLLFTVTESALGDILSCRIDLPPQP